MAPKRKVDRFLFVFNADTGTFNAFVDSAKKVLRIKGCTLCSITHGLAGEKSEWRDCKEEMGVPIDYVHRDEISPDLGAIIGDKLPCVVAQAGEDLRPLPPPHVPDRRPGSVAPPKGRPPPLA